MGWTVNGKIGSKLKWGSWNLVYKTDYQVSKIHTDLIEYVTKKLVKNK